MTTGQQYPNQPGGWLPQGGGTAPPVSAPSPVYPEAFNPNQPGSAATPNRPGVHIVRPIPADEGSSSFDAIAMKSVLTRARDSSRFQAPELDEDPAQGKPGSPLRVALSALAALVLLGVIAGISYVSFFREVEPDADTKVSVKLTNTVQQVTQSPQEVVKGYLEALAAGDIATALSFGPLGGDGSAQLLTPENHQKMATEARPEQIKIVTTDPLATEIKVSYLLAGQEVNTSIRVVRQDDGSYKLARTTVTVQTQVAGGQNLPMLINGVEVDHARPFEVVPGRYTLSTGLEFISYPEVSSFTIGSLAFTDTTIFPVNPQLTQAGRSALLDQARNSLNRCIASTALAPEGCPNAIRAAKPVQAGSVNWSLRNDPWQDFNPTLLADDQTIGIATVTVQTRVTMTYTDGRNSGNNDLNRNVQLRANLLGNDPDQLQVTWER